MKKYLQNCFLLAIPLICLMMIEVLLPSTFFTFRTWEGIAFTTKIPHYSTLYTNSKTFMNATGELCHHSNKAILKPELWITDKLGFRNNEFIDFADVFFIGDSFIAGCSLNQDDIISNKVKFKTNLKVYNMAPSSFSEFDYYLKTGIIKKPKVIIYSIVERNIPNRIASMKRILFGNIAYHIFSFDNINVYLDKAFRFSSLNWLRARINGAEGVGLPAKGDSNMFFLKGTSQKHNDSDLQTTLNNIKTYKKYCDSLKIEFIFMPMPDKETVYYNLVPLAKQPSYLFQLDSLLNIDGISTINTLKIYNEYRNSNTTLLYHFDDTHWNSNGVELISDEIVKKIRMIAQLHQR